MKIVSFVIAKMFFATKNVIRLINQNTLVKPNFVRSVTWRWSEVIWVLLECVFVVKFFVVIDVTIPIKVMKDVIKKIC